MAVKQKEGTRSGKTFQDEANASAARSISSMRAELDALQHAQECDGECKTCQGAGNLGGEVNGSPESCPDCAQDGKCKRGTETEWINGSKVAKYDDPDSWHDEDRARRCIEESPLSVEVRSGWYGPGSEPGEPQEYCILLGTGGPAARVVGDLENGEPSTATFEYQDWFKPWTPAETTEAQDETLLAWVQCFYFGS